MRRTGSMGQAELAAIDPQRTHARVSAACSDQRLQHWWALQQAQLQYW
jgi:hypothetical protein